LENLSEKSFTEWVNRFRTVEQLEMESALNLMIAEEDLRETESKFVDLQENSSRILIFCREKGEEELKISSRLKKLEEIARRRDRELKEANMWLELCIRRSKNRDKLKRKVNESCRWVDTGSFYYSF
jgi:hypothetical protein